MKIFTKRDKRTTIDKEIDSVIEQMSLLSPSDEGYKDMAANLEVLMKGRSYNKDKNIVSKDVLVTCIFGVVQILIIVGYEQMNVMGSKAVGFVTKGRV